jgi:hypothetical protein
MEGAQRNRPGQQHGGKGASKPLKPCLKQSDAPKPTKPINDSGPEVIFASYDSREEGEGDSSSSEEGEGDNSSSSSGSEGGDLDADASGMSDLEKEDAEDDVSAPGAANTSHAAGIADALATALTKAPKKRKGSKAEQARAAKRAKTAEALEVGMSHCCQKTAASSSACPYRRCEATAEAL